MHPSKYWEKSLEYASIDVWDEEVSMSKENEIHEAWKLEEHFRYNKEIPVSFIKKYFPDIVLLWSHIREEARLSALPEYNPDVVTHHYDTNGMITGKSYAKVKRHCCRCC